MERTINNFIFKKKIIYDVNKFINLKLFHLKKIYHIFKVLL
jgi:hypothetical protein